MNQRQLLITNLKEKGFKPLPVKSVGKKFQEEAEKQKRIVAESIDEVINSEGYMIYRDVEETLYFSENGFSTFSDDKNELKEVGFSRTRRYIDGEIMKDEFGISWDFYNKTIRAHFQIKQDVDLRTGKSDKEKIFYKTIDNLVYGLKRDLKITRVDVR